MKAYIILFSILLLVSCSNTQIIHLKSDGSIFLKGENIPIENLKNYVKSSEVIISVDSQVPYDKVINLMAKLKEYGVEKVGIKTSFKRQNE